MKTLARLIMNLTTTCTAVCLLSFPAWANSEVNLFGALTCPPTAKVPPNGFAIYESNSHATSTLSELEVGVARVALADGSVLTISVGKTAVGTIAIENGSGTLALSTQHKDTVPAVQIGSTISVADAKGNIVVSGAITDRNAELETVLSGTNIARVSPQGVAEYLDTAGRMPDTLLGITVSRINLADGTVLNVFVGNTLSGTMKLKRGIGSLILSTKRNNVVPFVQTGSILTVKDTVGNIILIGTF
jgi:hypothetical protein